MADSVAEPADPKPESFTTQHLRTILQNTKLLLHLYQSGHPDPEDHHELKHLDHRYPLEFYRKFASKLEREMIEDLEKLHPELNRFRMQAQDSELARVRKEVSKVQESWSDDEETYFTMSNGYDCSMLLPTHADLSQRALSDWHRSYQDVHEPFEEVQQVSSSNNTLSDLYPDPPQPLDSLLGTVIDESDACCENACSNNDSNKSSQTLRSGNEQRSQDPNNEVGDWLNQYSSRIEEYCNGYKLSDKFSSPTPEHLLSTEELNTAQEGRAQWWRAQTALQARLRDQRHALIDKLYAVGRLPHPDPRRYTRAALRNVVNR